MFDHVGFRVSDLAASKAFFLKAPRAAEGGAGDGRAVRRRHRPRRQTVAVAARNTGAPSALRIAFSAARAPTSTPSTGRHGRRGRDNGAPACARTPPQLLRRVRHRP